MAEKGRKKSTFKGGGQEVVRRRGTMRKLDVYAYPKRYEIVINQSENDGRVTISRKSENLSSWELYGVLHMTLKEIERQMTIKPSDEIERRGNELA